MPRRAAAGRSRGSQRGRARARAALEGARARRTPRAPPARSTLSRSTLAQSACRRPSRTSPFLRRMRRRGRGPSAVRDPVHVALRRRTAVCGAPKPRNAPFGGVFVATARARMRTFGQRYGPAGVDRAARQHHRRQRHVGAAVHHDVDVVGDQRAVAGDARAQADHRRVALGGGGDVLEPVVDDLDRPAALPRQQRRVRAIIDGYSSLPPKPPPVTVWITRTFSAGSANARHSALCT